MSYTLDTQIQSSTIYLDSGNCVARSPYFKYDLATEVKCPAACRMLLSVMAVSLPNVIQNVTENNNKLSFQILTSSGTSVLIYTLTIPPGIYSAWTFRDYINSQTVAPANSVQCVYDEKNFTYSFVSTFRFQVFSNTNKPTTCQHLIGVGKDIDNNFILPVVYSSSPAYTVYMPSTVNFNPSPYIFLKIRNFNLSNINSRGVINDALLRFPVNCNYGEMIQYRPTELNRYITSRNSISNIEILLEDINNNPLAIPTGAELQAILKIDYIFPPEQAQYDVGTISRFFKENPVKEDDEEEDDVAI